MELTAVEESLDAVKAKQAQFDSVYVHGLPWCVMSADIAVQGIQSLFRNEEPRPSQFASISLDTRIRKALL